MNVYAQLERVRDALIAKYPDKIARNNCWITDSSRPVRDFGRLYVQVFYGGGSYNDSGSGQLTCDYRLGVAIRNVLQLDRPERFEASTKELLQFARSVRNVIHNLYDPLFPEPPTIESDSGPRPSQGTVGESCYEMTFRAKCIEHYSEIKA